MAKDNSKFNPNSPNIITALNKIFSYGVINVVI